MSNVEPPPPNDDHAPEANAKPKGKRPWRKPRMKLIDVNFTEAGFMQVRTTLEADVSSSTPLATYRTS